MDSYEVQIKDTKECIKSKNTKYNDEGDFVFIEEVGSYFHDGKLDQLEHRLLPLTRIAHFEKNTIYSDILFREHLIHISKVTNLDAITSTVARCVEYGFKTQLTFLLNNFDRLLSLSDNNQTLDNRLLLRRLDLPCYILAKEFGFIDPELEKRISFLQIRFRQKREETGEYFQVKTIFSGSTPEEYMGNDLKGTRYWGYRQMLYYLRWNPKNRYRMLKLIKDEWWGDCRYQAYVDFLESKNEELIKWKR